MRTRRVFLGTECSPEIFPRPLPSLSRVTISVPGSSGGGVRMSHLWVTGPRPEGACKVTAHQPRPGIWCQRLGHRGQWPGHCPPDGISAPTPPPQTMDLEIYRAEEGPGRGSGTPQVLTEAPLRASSMNRPFAVYQAFPPIILPKAP